MSFGNIRDVSVHFRGLMIALSEINLCETNEVECEIISRYVEMISSAVLCFRIEGNRRQALKRVDCFLSRQTIRQKIERCEASRLRQRKWEMHRKIKLILNCCRERFSSDISEYYLRVRGAAISNCSIRHYVNSVSNLNSTSCIFIRKSHFFKY